MKNKKRVIKNRINRIFALVLCTVILLMTTTIPVSASSSDSDGNEFIYLEEMGLDLSYVTNTGYYYFNDELYKNYLTGYDLNLSDWLESYIADCIESVSYDYDDSTIDDYYLYYTLTVENADDKYTDTFSPNYRVDVYWFPKDYNSRYAIYQSTGTYDDGILDNYTVYSSLMPGYGDRDYPTTGCFWHRYSNSSNYFSSGYSWTYTYKIPQNLWATTQLEDGSYYRSYGPIVTTMSTFMYARLTKDYLLSTNIPIFEDEDSVINYIVEGDDSGVTNVQKEEAQVGADTFGFNSLTCVTTGELGSFCGNYDCYGLDFDTYSYDILATCTMSITYTDTAGGYQSATENQALYVNISDSDSYYTLDFDDVHASVKWGSIAAQEVAMIVDIVTSIKGSGTDLYGLEITNLTYTVTYQLRRSVPYYDSSSGLTVLESSKFSSDVRYFTFDALTGEQTASNSNEEGGYVDDGNVVVKTTTSYDDSGNVTDKSVSSVVVNDSSTGNTIVYMTYSDDTDSSGSSSSGSSEGQTFYIDNSSYSYSSGSDSSGTSSGVDASDYLDGFGSSNIIDSFTSLFGVDSGLSDDDSSVTSSSSSNGSIIGTIFRFMPSEFNAVLIGGIAIIVILAIVRLLAGIIT